MHWEASPRLEQKDFGAAREKVLIMSREIFRLKGEL
jgi:hypothetical protein